ncbi:gamma-glutamyltransferase [Paraliomyxa miuraensis]|uniref:gamma-glutamyltransferase n=1 Tax=Paraliomyxa miuraensis TaxID=376150 RepID=UPI00225796C0|nr:gamma-glutamyltransferase [Paraliomyxa miuraensis]MCX4245605.1 gamma-glutamyltransferase [Paraliomyxa miuraensis]
MALLLSACRSTDVVQGDPVDTTKPAPVAPVERRRPEGEARPPELALGTQGAVSSAEANASEVGLAIMRKGGNAVDAAVAVGLALAVTHPSAGNLGGGGFMVVRMADGTVATIDYREEAPSAAFRDMYLDDAGEPTAERLVGPKAAGIPGAVAGMGLAHERFGVLSWKDVVAPAVALAREGHGLDAWHAEDLAYGSDRMMKAGYEGSAAFYRKADGSEYAQGDTWAQPVLAKTLQAIADGGPRAFYEGTLAAGMVADIQAAGGIWKVEDLAAYHAKEREPIVFSYRGHEIVTMPPPSAGGVVLRQLLAASEQLQLEQYPWRSVPEVHLFAEAMRRTYADRNMLLGDPDFVPLPMDRLLDTQYVATRMADIDPDHATPSDQVGAGLPVRQESEQTTHYSVVDGKGNAVSTTTTLNLGFGAKYVLPGSGVLLNNEMDDFSVKPGTANIFGLVQGEPNKIEPGKRMLSSMTPTIVVHDGELRAVVGTPGGPTITTTVATVIRGMIDYGLPIDEAVSAPRAHHQWKPDEIWTEERLSPEVVEGLRAKGHAIRQRDAMGHSNCIEVDPTTRGFRAVADVGRDGGAAVAY